MQKKTILLALVVVLNILENKKPANHAEKTHFVSASCRAQHPRDPPPGFKLFALFNSGRELNNLNNLNPGEGSGGDSGARELNILNHIKYWGPPNIYII